jgi:hypothetical protein
MNALSAEGLGHALAVSELLRVWFCMPQLRIGVPPALSRQPQAGLQQSQYLESQPFWPPLVIGGGCPLPPLPPTPLLPPDPLEPLLPLAPFVPALLPAVPPRPLVPPVVPPLPPRPPVPPVPVHVRHEAAQAPFIQGCPHQPYSTACAQVSPLGGGVSVQFWVPPAPLAPLLPPMPFDPPLVEPPAPLLAPAPADPPNEPLDPPKPP